MFMLLKSEEKEEAKWAARDARDEQLFQLESKRIQHQLDKFERENARFQTAQQDQQLQAASLRNQILRGGGDGMALPGGMVEPAPPAPFGGEFLRIQFRKQHVGIFERIRNSETQWNDADICE